MALSPWRRDRDVIPSRSLFSLTDPGARVLPGCRRCPPSAGFAGTRERSLSPVKGGPGASLHSRDVRKMAVFLGVIGAVADYKHIADGETDEVDCDLDLAQLRLVEQYAGPEVLDPTLT